MAITIQDLAECLDKVGLQFMATIGLDGKPKVRPMQYMVMEDGRLWFCTNSQKAVYAELQANPNLELCGSRLLDNEIATTWVRLSAVAVFEDNRKVKEMIIAKSPIVHELYKDNPDNPIFRVFYLKDIKGTLANLGHVKGLRDRDDFAQPIFFEL